MKLEYKSDTHMALFGNLLGCKWSEKSNALGVGKFDHLESLTFGNQMPDAAKHLPACLHSGPTSSLPAAYSRVRLLAI
jgi:hypothetical protein